MATYGDHVSFQKISSSSKIQYKHASRRWGGIIKDTTQTQTPLIKVSHIRAHKILEMVFPNMNIRQRRHIPQQCEHLWEFFYHYARAACYPNTLQLSPLPDEFLVIKETGESYVRQLILFVSHYEPHNIKKRKYIADDMITSLIKICAFPIHTNDERSHISYESRMPEFPQTLESGHDEHVHEILQYLWNNNAQLIPEHLSKIETTQ